MSEQKLSRAPGQSVSTTDECYNCGGTKVEGTCTCTSDVPWPARVEPVYVAQTFEPEHLGSPEKEHAWFSARIEDGRERGGRSARMTRMPDGSGLLIEVWDRRLPLDQGEPRWSFTAQPGSILG